MSFTKNWFERQIALNKNQRIHLNGFAFEKLSLSEEYLFNDLMDVCAPPLALTFNDRLMAAANDSGDVALIDKSNLSPYNKWTAHNNAIFDLKWRKESQNQLGTASGDKSIIIWDINKFEKAEKFELAHNGSIKSIDFQNNNVFASGSRDGLIKVWDLRCSRGGPLIVIENAHLSKLPSVKASPKARPQKSSPLNSVTCVLFHPLSNHLYSSGANDGTIKVWDLRKCKRNKFNNKSPATPLRELYQNRKRGLPSHGFTSLAFNQNYKLFASCSNHNIYGYSGDNVLPSITCSGHQVNNFTRISPLEDNHVVSGSVNGKAFIWSIDWKVCNNKKIWPIYCLPHSEDEEVTAVVCDSDWLNIYTCCDDQRISKWSFNSSKRQLEAIIKSEPFVRKKTDIEVIDEMESSVTTPPLNEMRPFSSLTNWLETSGKQHSTPSNHNPKRIRLTQSTPTNKENKTKSSKRKLFSNNRKISDYFTP